MDVDCIPFEKTGYFSRLILDYLKGKSTLDPFYTTGPALENFASLIKERQETYPESRRKVLHSALENQYSSLPVQPAVQQNLRLLRSSSTFTVVTGHQLNLFTGPLYFLYKIITAIKLASALKESYPESNFVPVYWMATEDHDFEEINHFYLRGKKISWNRKAGGGVGRFDLDGLEAVYDTLAKELGTGEKPDTIKGLFRKAYLEHQTLTEATRFLADTLFGEYGLVIVDGDDALLKKEFVPYIEKDLKEKTSFRAVSENSEKLQQADPEYSIQVNPREVNYFYLKDGLRERLEEIDGAYYVLNTEIKFSQEGLLKELHQNPERFSPNVITRPLYQEVVLPNLSYIGGGGELAYWLQLKSMFDAFEISFPILMLRNSALLISEKQWGKLQRLNIHIPDLFLTQSSLINKKIREISNIEMDFSPQKKLLREQFEALYGIARETDPSFLGAVKAQEVKQLKGLDNLEKRLLRAQKRKLEDHVRRLATIHTELFPGQGLQERQMNFSELYLQWGDDTISRLLTLFPALPEKFLILRH